MRDGKDWVKAHRVMVFMWAPTMFNGQVKKLEAAKKGEKKRNKDTPLEGGQPDTKHQVHED